MQYFVWKRKHLTASDSYFKQNKISDFKYMLCKIFSWKVKCIVHFHNPIYVSERGGEGKEQGRGKFKKTEEWASGVSVFKEITTKDNDIKHISKLNQRSTIRKENEKYV